MCVRSAHAGVRMRRVSRMARLEERRHARAVPRGEPEVDELEQRALVRGRRAVDEVGRLHVPMHDAQLVALAQRLQHVIRDLGRGPLRVHLLLRLPEQPVLQLAARAELQDEVHVQVVLPATVELGDVAMPRL